VSLAKKGLGTTETMNEERGEIEVMRGRHGMTGEDEIIAKVHTTSRFSHVQVRRVSFVCYRAESINLPVAYVEPIVKKSIA